MKSEKSIQYIPIMTYKSKMLAFWIMVILTSVFLTFSCDLSAGVPELGPENEMTHAFDDECLFPCLKEKQDSTWQSEVRGQHMPITTTVTDLYISLSCEVYKKLHQVNDSAAIQYSVTNISNEVVYLVTPELKDITYSIEMKDKNDSMYNKDIHIDINKFQIYEEYFEMPRFTKIAPGEKYSDKLPCKLVHYTPGATFSVYVAVLYLSEKKKAEFELELSTLGLKAGAGFPYFVRKLTSSPIRLSIAG